MTVKTIAQGAIIAAVYAALTYLLAPISYGLMQVRVSEAMCVLPYFTPAAIPGLFVGCVIANLLGGFGIYDIVFGSLATLIAAFITHLLKTHSRWWSPLPAVLCNALIVGYMMAFIFNVGESFPVCAAYVGAGQLIACYGLGIPLSYGISKLNLNW